MFLNCISRGDIVKIRSTVIFLAALLAVLIYWGCDTSGDSEVGNPLNDFLKADHPVDKVDIPLEISVAGGKFVRSWLNEFNGHVTGWKTGFWGFPSNSPGDFTEEMVRIQDGTLRLGIREKSPEGLEKGDSYKKYIGGEYWFDVNPQQYGRFVVRMKPNSPSGVITSFFAIHLDFNEDYTVLEETSEVDIEFCGTTEEAQFAVHWIDPSGNKHVHDSGVPYTLPVDASDGFHLWEIEIMPSHIRYYYDGNMIHEITDPVILGEMEFPFETRMNYWITDSVPWAGEFDPSVLPLTTLYDYVAFYKWVPNNP